jgi:uncharacterized repeat protein (TIGR03803 family)
MQPKRLLVIQLLVLIYAITVMSPTQGWAADTEIVLNTFTGGTDGSEPYSNLIMDSAGNLYGTTTLGGGSANCPSGCGTAFKLTPVSGGWQSTIIQVFDGATDGSQPSALILDPAGDLYGTTRHGGFYGYGTVFRLTPVSGGGWQETVLHRFTGGPDGGSPFAGLVSDAFGNLYGTTSAGGNSFGTIFKLTLVFGIWQESVLYTFTGGKDGGNPLAQLTFDATATNLYGTTYAGGHYNNGTVFRLAYTSGGSWLESVLHSFSGGGDGGNPIGGLTFDAAGNLYGTTVIGGGHGYGNVFQLGLNSRGRLHETVLYAFTGRKKDGGSPYANVVFDTSGNLYGTTTIGGGGGYGTVFELILSGGVWSFSTLHNFMSGADGAYPFGGLTFAGGNLYGSTSNGGLSNDGIVFEIVP